MSGGGKHLREAVRLFQERAGPHGFDVAVEKGKTHVRVRLARDDGKGRSFFVSSTPRSSSCQLRQIGQEVTSWLEQEGLVEKRGARG